MTGTTLETPLASGPGALALGNRPDQYADLRAKNEELRTLIATRIEDRMYTLGLRSGERNSIINQLYGAYLNSKPGELLFQSVEEVEQALNDAKELAHLADLIQGQAALSKELAGLSVNELRAYLDTTYKNKQKSSFDRELDPASLLLEALTAAKLDKLPSNKTFKEVWEAGLPQPSIDLMGPGGYAADHLIPESTRTISAQELLANGPSELMKRLAAAGASRATRNPFQRYLSNGEKATGQCAFYVRKSADDIRANNGVGWGDGGQHGDALRNHRNFARVTGVTIDMLDQLPEGCIVCYDATSTAISKYGHSSITLDPSKNNGFKAVSHIFQKNRLVYAPKNLEVYIPVATY